MSELRLPQRNLTVWFEIPVRELQAAIEFYQQALGLQFRLERRAGQTRAIIEDPRFANGGALVCAPERAGRDGTWVYLHAGPDLEATLARVATAGGTLTSAPIDLGGGLGRTAVMRDPDANPIGLYSPAGGR